MKTSLSIFVALCIFFHAEAQTTTPKKTFSENLSGVKTAGSELTKNSSSVSQSGTMSTSVPLVKISSRTMSYPIELHYAAGITASQGSGSVGLGWMLPVGSIVRDFGAFEPDYTSTKNESQMLNSVPGAQNGWMETAPNANNLGIRVDPWLNHQYLGYDAVAASSMSTPMSDKYRVNVPGFISNTFWNGGAAGAATHTWKLSQLEQWKVESSPKVYKIAQEYSRINESNVIICTGCADSKEDFDIRGSYAAAIGVLPYVKNGKVTYPTSTSAGAWNPANSEFPGNTLVEYEDFGKFIITDEKGVRYVFGRALRGQKFVFNDDPYWTTGKTERGASEQGNFWKIDYIAEWLLTEIWSPDYVDANGNGMADDGDGGDWIRFEYTAPTKMEETTFAGAGHIYMNQEVPSYREWSSFSQTDRASSLMREMAYLTKIVTPTQYVDFTISQRMEVDHDYYSKPANKINNEFYYEDQEFATTGVSTDFDIVYPVETMKYDSLKVFSKLIDKLVYPSEKLGTSTVVLKYAAKGSAEELAVSSYLIRNNNNVDKLVDKPSDSDAFNIELYKNTAIKRGKTTLTQIDFLDGNKSTSDVVSYKFEYGYNPSYDEIHKREIVRKYYFPSTRQSYALAVSPDLRADGLISYTESVINSAGTAYNSVSYTGTGKISPYDFLIDFPFKENKYILAGGSTQDLRDYIAYGTTSLPITYESVTHPLAPVIDQFGYLYGNNCTKCPEAWSLTKITYPGGGQESFQYEQGDFDLVNDAPHWSFKQNEIPIIKEYNALAKKRSLLQDAYNRYATAVDAYTAFGLGNQKTRTATYEVDLPNKYGIRLKKQITDDKINPMVEVSYQYTTGHFTSLPADYVSNYMRGFNDFVMRERFRHDWEKNFYTYPMISEFPNYTTDYAEKMRPVAINNMTLDDYQSVHFYETVKQVYADQSAVKRTYGSLTTLYQSFPVYTVFCSRLPSASWQGRYILAGNTSNVEDILLKKEERFAALASTPYQTDTYYYTRYVDVPNIKKVHFNYLNTNNEVELWSNTFESWFPIYRLGTPGSYYVDFAGPFYNNLGFQLGPFSDPNFWTWNTVSNVTQGKAFAYDKDNFAASLSLPYGGIPNYSFEKWITSKTYMHKKETNYKGIVSYTEYTFHPTKLYLQSEKKWTQNMSEIYFTKYEYAHEIYNGLTTKFTDLNLLDLPARTTNYLGSMVASNAIGASAITYDYSLPVPKVLDSYVCEMPVDHVTGKFTLPAFSTSSSVWRVTESDEYLYNPAGMPVSLRHNQLYNKVVSGNGLSVAKANITSTEGKFDATYSSFDDLTNPLPLDKWNSSSYLKEQWYTFDANTFTINSTDVKVNISDFFTCTPNSSSEVTPGLIMYHVISLTNVDQLYVGQSVTITFTRLGVTTSATRTIASITPKASIPELAANSTFYSYILCFTEVTFPNSTMPITDVKITGSIPKFEASKTYVRTGKYSYKIPTVRTLGDNPKKTPVRPVKIDFALACSEQPEDPGESSKGAAGSSVPNVEKTSGSQLRTVKEIEGVKNPGTSNLTADCYYTYEASVWLKYDLEVIPKKGFDPVILIPVDATYDRGVIASSGDYGVRIVCTIWNASRTSVVQQYTFYPQDLNNLWKQYKVEFQIVKGAQQWVDVHVENDMLQLGGVSTATAKAIYADDILVYPKDAKYNYAVYDKFGNITFNADNNDVFSSTDFNEKNRPVTVKNVYNRVVKQIDYFDQAFNWSAHNNYVTERNFLSAFEYNDVRHYKDGFGKTKQTIISDNVRNARMISGTQVYNGRGNPYQSWKPYFLAGSTLDVKYHSDFAAKAIYRYGSNTPYTKTNYEATPDAKVSSIEQPKMNMEASIVSLQSDYVNTTALTHPYLTVNPTYGIGTLIVDETIDPMGNKNKTFTDNFGRLIMEEQEIGYEHTQALDGSITIGTTGYRYARIWYVYDGASRLIASYDSDGKKTEYFYNSIGMVVKTISPDRGTEEMRYDRYGQVRFTKNAVDLTAIQSNIYGCDQFKYVKYDKWGRHIEHGVLTVAPNSLGGSTTSPPFPTAEFFDDGTVNIQDFPNATQKFVQVHETMAYGNSRALFNSNSLITQTVYSEHTLNTTTHKYTAAKTDQTAYTYKANGQPAKISYTYAGLAGVHEIIPVYNDMHLPIGKDYTNSVNSNYNYQWRTTLDNLGRPVVSMNVHGTTTTQTAKNFYDLLGNRVMTGIGTTGVPANPHIDYHVPKMDIRDQLVSQMSKFFRFGLTYNAGGNITNQYWSNEYFDPAAGSAVNVNINQYAYTYDRMGRLIGADYKQSTTTSNPFSYFYSLSSSLPTDSVNVYNYLQSFPAPVAASNSIKYDAGYWYTNNGNVSKLTRNNELGVRTQQVYTYANSQKNHLTGVTWSAPGTTTFSHTYSYDANGNLLNDSRNSISAIGYSTFNDLPTYITKATGTHKYRYTQSQQRAVKEISATDREYYIGDVVVAQDGKVKSYQTAEGYATPNATGTAVTYFYNVKDWLGTTRVVLNASGVVQNASDNDPYGKKLPGRNYLSTSYEGYRYQFTGHETDGETGYQYHGSRYYNEELARYMSVDPLAAKYAGHSTYNYCLGNPVRLTDPDGRDPHVPEGAPEKPTDGQRYTDKKGWTWEWLESKEESGWIRHGGALDEFTLYGPAAKLRLKKEYEIEQRNKTSIMGQHFGNMKGWQCRYFYDDPYNPHRESWLRRRANADAASKLCIGVFIGGLTAPFIIGELIVAAPALSSAVKVGVDAYKVAWNAGGKANFCYTLFNEFVSNDGNPAEFNILALVVSGCIPGGAPFKTQMLVGAGGGMASVNLNKGFETYGMGKSGGETIMGGLLGGLSPMYMQAPILFKSPRANEIFINGLTGVFQNAVNKSSEEQKNEKP